MRRLPIYFVLDVSESMVGENLKKLDDGINSIIRMLRQDPHALETVYVSVIAFAGKARTIVPLVELATFYPPKLPIGGGTSLGEALHHLMTEIDKTIVKTTLDKKGDWKPIIYLITDGKPTDSVSSAVTEWKKRYANRTTLVAIALGRFADVGVLKQLTEHALLLENTTDQDFKKFIAWVTDSVKSQSKSVSDAPSDNANLAKIDETILSLIKDNKELVDTDYVILTGRCQRTRLPYLMKYERNTQHVKHQDVAMDALSYMLSGCYPVDEEYFRWSVNGNSQLKVNTRDLLGVPGCPHCGNSCALAMCYCSGIMCFKGPGAAVCPWCEKEVNFATDGNSGDKGFDVNRARG